MSYTYKGTDIKKLIIVGSSSLSNYSPFPSYKPASTYSTERPLTFGIEQSNVDVLNLMDASYIELTGSGTYTIPSDYNAFRAVLEGGGGGGGGGAACGVDGKTGPDSRRSTAPGAPGSNGGFVYISDTHINNNIITYSAGTGGAGGPGGGDAGGTGQATPQANNPGTSGQNGNVSYINFTTDTGNYTVTANAGTGGSGGNTQDTPAVTQTVINYQQSSLFFSDGNQQTTAISSNINPLSYLTTYSNRGAGGSDNQPGPGVGSPGGTGNPGYIRIYLLKD